MRAGGHVFVVRGDLRRLAVDAWLLPCDALGDVSPMWFDDAPSDFAPATVEGARGRRRLVLGKRKRRKLRRTGSVTLRRARPGCRLPAIVAIDVGGTRRTRLRWYAEQLESGLERAVAVCGRGGGSSLGRACPLIGMPLVGTGQGGASERKGAMIRLQLRAVARVARRLRVDVVVVTGSDRTQDAVRWVRQRTGVGDWRALGKLRSVADELAELSADEQLVPFIGAGISAAAGLPLWGRLLDELAEAARIEDVDVLHELDLLDQARAIEARIGRDLLKARVAEIVGRAPRPALAHLLLANLRTESAATTNYDALYEQARRQIGMPVASVPYEDAGGQTGWIVKLHGTVGEGGAQDIVLTREDYLRYAGQRGALSGIVAALLVTRHMLFVGFSMTDDNFRRILDDVRLVAERTETAKVGRRRLGTALVFDSNHYFADLYNPEIRVHSARRRSETSVDAARRVEIFLDYLSTRRSRGDCRYVLDPAYRALLSRRERSIRRRLERLVRDVPANERRTPAWQQLAGTLRDLGQPVLDVPRR